MKIIKKKPSWAIGMVLGYGEIKIKQWVHVTKTSVQVRAQVHAWFQLQR